MHLDIDVIKLVKKEKQEMVIQSNMSSKAIVDVWEETTGIFNKYQIPIVKQSLDTVVEEKLLTSLLKELNSVIGSSTATCIEGG
jgi:hypothetical protein